MTRFIRAWQLHAKGATFFGQTLPQFKAALEESFDTRERIAHLQRQLRSAITRRNTADKRSMRLMRGVTYSVMADPDHGEDAPLYDALGFVTRSARRKRRRKPK